ncbi:hypothetical protein Tco_0028957 [Tanacetum coccineum]
MNAKGYFFFKFSSLYGAESAIKIDANKDQVMDNEGFCLVKRRENNGNFKSFVKHRSKFEYKARFSDVAVESKQVNVQKEASSLTRGSIPLSNPFDLLNTDVDNVLEKGKKVVNTYATDHVNISVSIDEEDEDDVENVFDETIGFITNTNHNVTKTTSCS